MDCIILRRFALPLFAWFFGFSVSYAQSLDIEQIFQQWQSREELYKNVQGAWIYNRAAVPLATDSLKDHVPISPLGDARVSFWLSETSMRVDVKGSYPTIDSLDPSLIRSVYGSDGGSEGVIDGKNVDEEWRRVEFMGFLWFFRPSRLGANQSANWRILSRRASIRGVDCVVLTRNYSSGLKDVVYVDTQRACLPVRHELVNSGVVWCSTDMKYKVSKAGTWYPSEWSFRHPGLEASCSQATFEFVDTIPASQFEEIFPVGMRVYDKRVSMRKYDAEFVVQNDGSLQRSSVTSGGIGFQWSLPNFLFSIGILVLIAVGVRRLVHDLRTK